MASRSRLLFAVLVASGCAAQPLARPEPPRERLAATRAAELGGRWSNLTKYCVEPDGSTSESATVYSSGDPALDRIYLDTVATWQFRPRSRRRCDTVRFDEDFGPDRRPGVAAADLAASGKRVHFKPIATPRPSARQIGALTKQAKISRWTLINRTAYCAGPDGRVRDVETLRSSGVPEIDAYLRATVATWRYEPVTVDSRPGCTSTEFMFTLDIP